MTIDRKTIIIFALLGLVIVLIFFSFHQKGIHSEKDLEREIALASIKDLEKREVVHLARISQLEADRKGLEKIHTSDSLENVRIRTARFNAKTKAKPVTVNDSLQFINEQLSFCDSTVEVQDRIITELTDISRNQDQTIQAFGNLVQLKDMRINKLDSLEVRGNEKNKVLTKENDKLNRKNRRNKKIAFGFGVIAVVIGALAF